MSDYSISVFSGSSMGGEGAGGGRGGGASRGANSFGVILGSW